MTTATQSNTRSLPAPEPMLVPAANIDPARFYTLAEVANLIVHTSTRRPVNLQTVRNWRKRGLLRTTQQKYGLKRRFVIQGADLIAFLADFTGVQE